MYTSAEYLQVAIESGMIDLTTLQAKMEMAERERYLNGHKIWQGKNGYWYTRLNDRLIKKRNKGGVEEEIIRYEKSVEDRPTVRQVFYRFLDQKLRYKDIERQTYNKYEFDYNRYIAGTELEKMEFRKVTEEYLEDFIRNAIADHEMTSKSFAGLRTIIRGMLLYAKGKYTDISAKSFFGDMQFSKNTFKKKIIYKEREVFLDEEIPLVMKYLDEHINLHNLAITLAFNTGIRIGELSTIRKSDIVNESGCYSIHIQRTESKYKENGKYIVYVKEYPKSSAGDRYVFLNDKARKVIEKAYELNPDGEYLFQMGSRRIRVSCLHRNLKKVCCEVGIPFRSMHKIRKTYGTAMIDGGVDEAIIIEQMGHSDIHCTKQYYYFSNKNRKKKMEQLEKIAYT